MKSGDAGILSSARLRFANFSDPLFLAVRRLLHLAHRAGFQLFALALGRRDSVLDGLADRVVRVADHLPRALRRVLRPLHRFATPELDGLGAQTVDLLPPWPRPDLHPPPPAHHAPAHPPA